MTKNSVGHENSISHAKTRVAHWSDQNALDPDLRSRLLRGVEAIAVELPRRSEWGEVLSVGLGDSKGPSIYLKQSQWRVFPTNEHLFVSSLLPGWGFGWREILGDEDVYEILSWFLHYCRQYIHRANIAKLLMISWEDHEILLGPFGSKSMVQRYGPYVPLKSTQEVLDHAMQLATQEYGDPGSQEKLPPPTVSDWLRRNTSEPYLHQAIFHYLRAQALLRECFSVEAVVAFDCCIQSIRQLWAATHRMSSSPSRGEICDTFGLSQKAHVADYAYFLRNNFGAHAGGWRWWDSYELLDENDVKDIADLAHQIVVSAADAEPGFRRIDPEPSDWAPWFFDNFKILWDTLWFDRLDQWIANHDK